jgi:hypothetical protein
MGNHNSGRRPRPTALKLLKGEKNKDRINLDEPKPPQASVKKPQMAPDSGVVWDRVAPIALAMGTLTAADVDAFKAFCQLQAALDLATGADLMRLAQTIRPYYGMFGLEPSGRSRIKIPKADKPESKWAGLVG